MINTERFYEILTQFKQEFSGEHWQNESAEELYNARHVKWVSLVI